MALAKTGYTSAIRGTAKVNLYADEDGYISSDTTSVAAVKAFSLNAMNAENSLQDNTDVFAFLMDLAVGVQNSGTNKMTVTWEV